LSILAKVTFTEVGRTEGNIYTALSEEETLGWKKKNTKSKSSDLQGYVPIMQHKLLNVEEF